MRDLADISSSDERLVNLEQLINHFLSRHLRLSFPNEERKKNKLSTHSLPCLFNHLTQEELILVF